jgi:hypothetical protein
MLKLATVGVILSGLLIMASLWQIEIATGWVTDTFNFPFFLWRVDKWLARDFWYAISLCAWALAALSGWYMRERSE